MSCTKTTLVSLAAFASCR